MAKVINMDILNDVTKKLDTMNNPEGNQEEVDKSIDYCVNHVGKYYDGSPKANSTNVAIGRMIYLADKNNDLMLKSAIAQLMHDYRMYNFAYTVQGYISAKRSDEGLDQLSLEQVQDLTAEAASCICLYTDFMQIKLPDLYTTPAPVTGDDPEPDE